MDEKSDPNLGIFEISITLVGYVSRSLSQTSVVFMRNEKFIPKKMTDSIFVEMFIFENKIFSKFDYFAFQIILVLQFLQAPSQTGH